MVFELEGMIAEVAELADALGLGPSAARRVGSTPTLGTKKPPHVCGGFRISILFSTDLQGAAVL